MRVSSQSCLDRAFHSEEAIQWLEPATSVLLLLRVSLSLLWYSPLRYAIPPVAQLRMLAGLLE